MTNNDNINNLLENNNITNLEDNKDNINNLKINREKVIDINLKKDNLYVPKLYDIFNKNVTNNYHNKTIMENDKYGDSYDVDDIKTFRDLINNKKFLLVLSSITLLVVCVVVIKTFYLGHKVDKYEEFFTEITEIQDNSVKVYQDNVISTDLINNMAASELINCLNSKVDIDNLPSEISSIIDEINNFYNRNNNYFGFGYKDIFTGFTVSYNANQNIFTASAIKAPTDIYVYEMASLGKIDLDEVVTYTSNYYNTGSGVLKNKPINSKYDIRTLLEYSTVTSDNAAHNMLMDKYGRENMRDFWSNLGTNAIFIANNNWGVMNVHDALIYMNELYSFYTRDNEYGKSIMNNFLNAYPTFLKGNGEYPVANKSGWSGTAIHDVAIVFANNPYIVVALSNTGQSDYTYYFNTANDLASKLHDAYWKYKMDNCSNIKQY